MLILKICLVYRLKHQFSSQLFIGGYLSVTIARAELKLVATGDSDVISPSLPTPIKEGVGGTDIDEL